MQTRDSSHYCYSHCLAHSVLPVRWRAPRAALIPRDCALRVARGDPQTDRESAVRGWNVHRWAGQCSISKDEEGMETQ
jgi:hypothetical protein